MVMWSHWNRGEQKSAYSSFRLLKWKRKCPYLLVGHSYGSRPYHVICLEFDCNIFRRKSKTPSHIENEAFECFLYYLFYLFCLLTCVVILILNIPRPTYTHLPLTHRSCSPVSEAGRGSRGS